MRSLRFSSSLIKKLMIVMVFVMVFCSTPLFFHSSLFEAEALTDVVFDDIDVVDDIIAADLDLTDYQYNQNRSLEVFNFVEFGYSEYQNQLDNYGLYVYLYNPERLDLNLTSGKNKIEMAIGWDNDGNPNRYEKFLLSFCSISEVNPVYHTLIKYRVVDHVSSYDDKNILQRVLSSSRRYDLSGIELLINGDTNATEYGIGQTYTFTGFGEGLASSGAAALSCISTQLETIELDVEHTNYRTGISDLGPGHQNEINSVYFSVPNKYFDEFGTLQRILAEWFEYKTKNIVVTTNQAFYDQLELYKIFDVGDHSDDVPYNIYSGYEYTIYTPPFGGAASVTETYNWVYNIAPANAYGHTWSTDSRSTILPINFKVNSIDDEVSKELISEKIYDLALYGDSSLAIDENVDPGRTKGYNLKEFDAEADIQQLLSYNSTHGFWDRWADFGLNIALFGSEDLDEDLTVLPIYKIQASDMLKTDAELSSSLLINASDVNAFKNAYIDSTMEDSSLVLFRFAINDYYSERASRTGNTAPGSEDTYVCSETYFNDFDIIQLTFHRDGIYKVIPVVSSPMDIINGITPPVEPEPNDPLEDIFGTGYDWLLDLWEKAKPYLMVVAAVLVLLLLIPIIKFIVTIISGLAKASKKSVEKQKNRDKLRK